MYLCGYPRAVDAVVKWLHICQRPQVQFFFLFIHYSYATTASPVGTKQNSYAYLSSIDAAITNQLTSALAGFPSSLPNGCVPPLANRHTRFYVHRRPVIWTFTLYRGSAGPAVSGAQVLDGTFARTAIPPIRVQNH
jgi:hypothetical protein